MIGLRNPLRLPAGMDPVTAGVLIGFGAFAIYAVSDACVKLIEGQLPPYESAFFGAVFALLLLPALRAPGEPWRAIFATRRRGQWWLRFFAYPVGVMGSVTAFTELSMAEAFVLIFLMPAFVTVMSVVFIGERVGPRRWGAVVLGFIGVLIVLRPGFRELGIGHLGATLAGLCGAISVVSFRIVGGGESRLSLFGSGTLGGVTLCFVAMLPAFRWPDATQWALLAGYGLLAALANLMMMAATRLAPAAAVSPTQYSQMIWAIVLGYLIFGDGVDLPMLAGMVLIVGSGLLTLARERQRGVGLPPPVSASGAQAAAAIAAETRGEAPKDA